MGTSGAGSDITAGTLSLGHVGVTAKCASDAELIGLMLGHPVLTNRPIVVTRKGLRVCRPSEVVL
jgi:arsenate reductase